MGDRWPLSARPPLPIDSFTPPALGTPNPELVVAVVDTGIVYRDGKPHSYLDGHLTVDCQSEHDGQSRAATAGARSLAGHGTCVAGLILMQAPTAMICMRNVLDGATGKLHDGAVADAIRSFRSVAGVKVVNLSFYGRPGEDLGEPVEIRAAIEDLLAHDDDIVVVAAAGNDWTNALAWPAAFSKDFTQVVAVGAVDETVVSQDDELPPKASFSNYGEWVGAYASGVEVAGPSVVDPPSPGTASLGTPSTSGWSRWSGTSFAAATVAGAIADEIATTTGPGAGMRAMRQVLRGQRIPTPGVAPEHWSPYILARGPRPAR